MGNSNAEKIQIVINTLEIMSIPATFDNVNHLTGVYKLLFQVRDELAAAEKAEEEDDERMERTGGRDEAE